MLHPHAKLLNGSGPTECTLISTYHHFQMDGELTEVVSIGRPLPSYKCLVLDEYQQMVCLDQIGELYIAGQ